MHPCADEYVFVPVDDAGEASVLGCKPGDQLVVRLFGDSVPETLLHDGARVLARFSSGESAIGVLREREGRRTLTLCDGREADRSFMCAGLVISELQ